MNMRELDGGPAREYRLVVTGHRRVVVDMLPAYDGPGFEKLVQFGAQELKQVQARIPAGWQLVVLTGMALGWDQALALAASRLGIVFDAYIPFDGFDTRWPVQSRERYRSIVAAARQKVVVCEGEYEPWKLQKRNEAMVNAGDSVLALWDGTDGGTRNCVLYAGARDLEVRNAWMRWERWPGVKARVTISWRLLGRFYRGPASLQMIGVAASGKFIAVALPAEPAGVRLLIGGEVMHVWRDPLTGKWP